MIRFTKDELIERIIYEDSQICVLHKPAGIAVQSARVGQMDLESVLRLYMDNKYLGIIHRLDQPVEGLLVFAKNKSSANSLNGQMRGNKIKKKYLAIVENEINRSEGRLEDYLIKDAKSHMARIVDKGTPGAKLANLSYKKIQKLGDNTLVEIDLDTGRFHQIRAQMAHGDMPLLGDRKYNTETHGKQLALCAWKLEFIHPKSGKQMQFEIEKDLWLKQIISVTEGSRLQGEYEVTLSSVEN